METFTPVSGFFGGVLIGIASTQGIFAQTAVWVYSKVMNFSVA